jgi:hypothetical protein
VRTRRCGPTQAVAVDRDTLAVQQAGDAGECVDLRNDPERGVNLGAAHRGDARRGCVHRARSEPETTSRCSTLANTARSSEKPKPRPLASCSITLRQPVCSHNRPKIIGAPMRCAALVCSVPACRLETSRAGLGEPGTGAQQCVKSTVGLDTSQRGHHALAGARAVACVLDDLQVAARTGGLDAEEHRAPNRDTTI